MIIAANDNVTVRYATVCSGIEGPSVAWEPLGGFQPLFVSETERFPSAVIAHHFPNVPNLGDLTKINGGDWTGKVDVLWGSPPCQAFSAAGRRGGISDPRGALTLRFADLADQIRPAYVTLENVKGILSGRQNAFGLRIPTMPPCYSEIMPPVIPR